MSMSDQIRKALNHIDSAEATLWQASDEEYVIERDEADKLIRQDLDAAMAALGRALTEME